MINSVLAVVADTLLVRPVAVPAPWYSVATGVLSIVVTLLLLGIAVALLGMARALKGAEQNLGGRMQGLADELIPLARNLNHIATQLSEVTGEARGELKRLSGTISVVDDAVRDAIDAGEDRLAQFGRLLDAVQDEAQATIASATGVMRGVRTGAGAMISGLFDRNGSRRPTKRRTARHLPDDERRPLDEDDVRARLAALEAAFAERDDEDEDFEDDVRPARSASADRVTGANSDAAASDEEWDDEDDDDELLDDEDELDDEADDEVDDEVDGDDEDDDIDDDADQDDDDDRDDGDEEYDGEPVTGERVAGERVAGAPDESAPRSGGPRIRHHPRA